MPSKGFEREDFARNARLPHGSILGPTLFPLYTNERPDNVICNIAICVDDSTLYSTLLLKLPLQELQLWSVQ